MNQSIKLLAVCIIGLIINSDIAFAQVNKNSELFKTLKSNDSILFKVGFNKCEIEKSAKLIIERYIQEHGEYPETLGISVWGTSTMRTGGDDIAQAFALMGVQPIWKNANRRVSDFEVIPLLKLQRPRVDVTLRISGFFRDAFDGGAGGDVAVI